MNRQAWLRFFIAIAGLAIAFAAALYSTVLRESGYLWPSAAIASLSLLLAGFVGVVTVPYLARRVALERVREAFDYDITREGLIYMLLVVVIGVAALNTGNNLLFVVLSAMLAAILVSGIASALVLRPLELDVSLPTQVFAGASVLARLSLRNPRHLLPSFSINVVPPRPSRRGRLRLERTTFHFPWWRPPEKRWFRTPDLQLRLAAETPAPCPLFTGSVYFPYVPARGSATAELPLQFDRRGRYEQEAFGLSTRFPFSFLLKTRRITLARELIVFPSVEPTDSSLEVLPMMTGEFESFVRGRGNDLYLIREHQPEDSRRYVDWKATAKTGQLKVREFTREDERKLRVIFDNPAPGVLTDSAYEAAVRTVASLAWHFVDEATELTFAAAGHRSDDVFDFLRFLALVQPESRPSVLDELHLTDDYNLIVTARPRGSISTALWACSYIVFLNGNGI